MDQHAESGGSGDGNRRAAQNTAGGSVDDAFDMTGVGLGRQQAGNEKHDCQQCPHIY